MSTTAGCADGPADRYAKAVEASAALREAPKTEQAKAADDLLHFFTAESADVLRGVFQVKRRSSRFEWLDLAKFLTPGEAVEVKEDGDMRLLVVEDAKGKKSEVRMVLEEGLWVIDGFGLPRFWSKLRATSL